MIRFIPDEGISPILQKALAFLSQPRYAACWFATGHLLGSFLRSVVCTFWRCVSGLFRRWASRVGVRASSRARASKPDSERAWSLTAVSPRSSTPLAPNTVLELPHVRERVHLRAAFEHKVCAPEQALLGLSLLSSAFLLSVACAGPGHAWTGWMSLFPLFVSFRVLRPAGAGLSGSFWGLCLALFTYLFHHYQAGLSAASPGSAWVRQALLLTVVPALYGCSASWLTRRIGFTPFMLSAGWMLVEFGLSPLKLRAGLAGPAPGGWLSQVTGGALGPVVAAFLAAYFCASLVAVLPRWVAGAAADLCETTEPNERRAWTRCVASLAARVILAVPRPRAPPSACRVTDVFRGEGDGRPAVA